jgi:hypothetical protein
MECGRMTVKNTCQTDGTRYVPDVNVLEFWALVLDQVCKYWCVQLYSTPSNEKLIERDNSDYCKHSIQDLIQVQRTKNPLYSESLLEFHSKTQFWTVSMFASVARL